MMGNNCCWIFIILILFFVCGNNSWCNSCSAPSECNGCGNNCGCGC